MSQRPVFEVRLRREITQVQTALVRVEASTADVARVIARGWLTSGEIGSDEWCTDMLDAPRHGPPEITEITPAAVRMT